MRVALFRCTGRLWKTLAGSAGVTATKIKEKSRDPKREKPLPQFSRLGSGLLEDPKKGPQKRTPKKGPPKKDPQRLIFDHRQQLIISWRYIPRPSKNGRRCQKIDHISRIDAKKEGRTRTRERALERERPDRDRPPMQPWPTATLRDSGHQGRQPGATWAATLSGLGRLSGAVRGGNPPRHYRHPIAAEPRSCYTSRAGQSQPQSACTTEKGNPHGLPQQ